MHIPLVKVRYSAQLPGKPISLLSINSGSKLLYTAKHWVSLALLIGFLDLKILFKSNHEPKDKALYEL